MGDPKGFLKVPREVPHGRPVDERVKDWREMYKVPGPSFSEEQLKQQGSRCMDCGVPFCQSSTGCPVVNLIPDWNDLVYRGQWREALVHLHSTNNFPEFTGRLCPAPCESACVLGISSDPVAIKTIEWSIIERGFEEGWVVPSKPAPSSGKRVAVVGSGPAGLAAAQQLARAGHAVMVFEKADQIGGLLRYGIPDFKMEKRFIDRRLEQMKAEGVRFVVNSDVGGKVDPHELLKEFDAICLCLGAEQPRDLPAPGRHLDGVHFAMDFLTQQNRRNAGLPVEGPEISAHGKRVVIIGGGDTGSDCLGTAHRQGALEVHQFELLPKPPEKRDPSTPWPLWPMQLRSSHAHQEGGARHWSISTTEFVGENGKLTGLRTQQVAREAGSFKPVAGSDAEMKAELVLLAMGFTGPVHSGVVQKLGLQLDARGNIATDIGYRTSARHVYASGDARRGQSLIVWAIAEGRKMAAQVDADLRADSKRAAAGARPEASTAPAHP